MKDRNKLMRDSWKSLALHGGGLFLFIIGAKYNELFELEAQSIDYINGMYTIDYYVMPYVLMAVGALLAVYGYIKHIRVTNIIDRIIEEEKVDL